jgi:hypothetical protein
MPDTDIFDPDSIELTDDPESDTHVRLNRTDVERLRKAAKGSTAVRKELDEYKRRDAITAAGLTGLSAKQSAALAKLVEDVTPENLRAEAEALGWVEPPAPDPDAVTAEELQAHGDLAAAGVGGGIPASTTAKPDDVAGWPVDKRMRFMNAHPDLHENLLRGESIQLPVAFL